jgi:hypothetical protein
MKRDILILFSFIALDTRISQFKCFGMFLADKVVFLYSILRIKPKFAKVKISKNIKSLIKFVILIMVTFILILISYIESSRNQPKLIKIFDQNNKKFMNKYRIKCIEDIKGMQQFFL